MKKIPRRLGVESLETRDLMAGNITAVVSNGNLQITGDDAANIFVVVQTGPQKFQITGTSTTINSSATAKTFTGVKNILIDTFGGNDRITVGGVGVTSRIQNELRVRSGSGADLLLVQGIVAAKATCVMGGNLENDKDTLTVKSSTISGTALLQMGNGDDTVNLTNSKALTKLQVDMAGGNDRANVTNGTVGDLTLNCGAGDDTGYFAGKLFATGIISADGGPGIDTATKDPNAELHIDDPDAEDHVKNFETDDLT